MLQFFTTFFSFLHHHTKSFLCNHNPKSPRRRSNTSLFSPKDSNFQDSSISLSNMDKGVSNQFKQVFKLIDTNGDGKISPTEINKILIGLGTKKKKKIKKSSSSQEAEKIVKVLDFNGDGFVDLDEFMVVVMEELEDGDDGKKKEEEALKDAFLIFDSDGNGVIDAKELQRVLVNLGCDENCSLKDCKRMIKGVDKNGDGFVDFEEFRSMMMMIKPCQ